MIRNYYLFIFFGIIICISFFLKNLNKEESNAIDIINNEYIQEDVTNHFITDVAIKNIIVYPNWENKNSLYVDIDIENINGDEKVQISLSNGNKLIGSDQILLQPEEKKYSQSLLQLRSLLECCNLMFSQIYSLHQISLEQQQR